MVIIARAPGNEALGKPTEEIHDLHDRLNLIKAGSNWYTLWTDPKWNQNSEGLAVLEHDFIHSTVHVQIRSEMEACDSAVCFIDFPKPQAEHGLP